MLQPLRTEVIISTIKLWRTYIAISGHPDHFTPSTSRMLNKKSAVDGVRIYLTVLLYFVHKLVLTWLRGFQDKPLYFLLFYLCPSVTHTRGLVPATSPCNKSRGEVPSCELAILLQNLFAGTNFGPCD